MPELRNRIFISIGVSKPLGGLDELPGAITAAERMAAWAKGQGYRTLLFHDGDLPEVTIAILRKGISDAIKDVTRQAELERLVIFFAGHGAALAIGDQYWILTNWEQDLSEAIKVSSFQRMLEYYGPRQVSIIGDACQEFSSKFVDLVGNGVLLRPKEDQRPYELDQFFAVDVGKQAFMIRAKGEDQKDFCLFTEVLLDALEGDAQEPYFEEIGADKVVTSQSLARYLDNTIEREAGRYGVRMVPRPRPGFYTDRTYMSIQGTPDNGASPFNLEIPGGFDNQGGLLGGLLGGNVYGQLDPARIRPSLRSVTKVELVTSKSADATLDDQARAQDETREAIREAFVDEVSKATVRDHFETGCGICVSGASVANVELSFGDVSGVNEQPNWFRVKLETGDADGLGWSDTLVTLADGRIVPVCAINGFIAALHIIDTTSLSLFHRQLGADVYEGGPVIELLARAHAGLLSPQAIIDAAARLRYTKHRIVTLGCIAAQFYDAIRDVDSLRSMAAFYAMNHQPVPLDIILYGGGTVSYYGGRLYADIPQVAAREPRTAQEQAQSFTYNETPGFVRHPIAGRIPWMRQAWGAVATASYDASAMVWRRQAETAMKYLAPGIFTIVRPGGRQALLKLAGISVKKAR